MPSALKNLIDGMRSWLAGKHRRLAVKSAALLGLGLILYFFAYPQLYATYHSWRADQALQIQDCATARIHLQKCLSIWTGSSQRHFETARCCWREGDLDEAERELRQAATCGWPLRAINMERLFVEAQRELTPTLEITLANIFADAEAQKDERLKSIVLEASLLALLRAGNIEAAQAAAQALVNSDPEDWRPHWLLGRVRAYTSPERARESYDRSLTLKPDQPEVHFWLAKYYAGQRQPTEALEHLRESGRVSAPDAESSFAAARIHYLAGDWQECMSCLERVLADPTIPQGPPLALRGLLALEENRVDGAVGWLKKAEARAPYHPEIIAAWTVLATRQGNEDLLRRYQQRTKRYQENAGRIPALYKKLNELRHQAQPRAGEREEIAFQLGSTLFQMGEDPTAEKWMKSVLRDNPTHAAARQALAAYYERAGMPEQAATYRPSVTKSTSMP